PAWIEAIGTFVPKTAIDLIKSTSHSTSMLGITKRSFGDSGLTGFHPKRIDSAKVQVDVRKDRVVPKSRVAGIDLFCGAGGLTYGLQQAQIEIVAGVDLDPSSEFPFSRN